MKQKQNFKTKHISISLALVFCLIFLLAGCTQKTGSTEQQKSFPQTSSSPQSAISGASSEPDDFNSDDVSSSDSKADAPLSNPADNLPSGNANLDAVVIELLAGGIKARPTITTDTADGQVAEQRLGEDDGTDITVIFTEDTVFQIKEIDRSTYDFKCLNATSEDVKKDSSIYVWGTYSGTELSADNVVIVRYK